MSIFQKKRKKNSVQLNTSSSENSTLEDSTDLNSYRSEDHLSPSKKEIQPSENDLMRSQEVKLYLENYYGDLSKSTKERINRRIEFERAINEKNLTKKEIKILRENFFKMENRVFSLKLQRLKVTDFQIVKIIGKGAFGTIQLVKDKSNNKICAMKTLKKTKMIAHGQVDHVKTERDLMVLIDNPWVVNLFYSFQDENYLYLIMEYVPGGDMMTHLIRNQVLTEEQTKFYIAETIIAVSTLHKMNFIHRDLKPDNLLLDREGHIKLSDFGLSTAYISVQNEMKMEKNIQKSTSKKRKKINTLKSRKLRETTWKQRRKLAYSTVGTPDYIAIEIFWQTGYTETCDWWSLGVIMFEMLYGFTPFVSKTRKGTFQSIMNWKENLIYPEDIPVSPEAIDLMTKLICEPSDRLGKNGVEEIQNHAFFQDIDWTKIEKRALTPPIVPTINDEIDTQNFDDFSDELSDDEEEKYLQNESKKEPEPIKNFLGYTFKRVQQQNPENFIYQQLKDLQGKPNKKNGKK
ncbi:serine/threonine-protein kinase ndrb-related [Anaeramoeba flamelloides]|uniref:non-specific serine/threonine protein kinase n=1 Tax=Anaeramoeba flamelloides TaxID=1746091 RepID=A0AAV7Z4H9_9EUKA|nr:serine/threonine-protein kinase ndrb-related [Anaeramoeba flamelloides]